MTPLQKTSHMWIFWGLKIYMFHIYSSSNCQWRNKNFIATPSSIEEIILCLYRVKLCHRSFSQNASYILAITPTVYLIDLSLNLKGFNGFLLLRDERCANTVRNSTDNIISVLCIVTFCTIQPGTRKHFTVILLPIQISKTALAKNCGFEKTCKSSYSEPFGVRDSK